MTTYVYTLKSSRGFTNTLTVTASTMITSFTGGSGYAVQSISGTWDGSIISGSAIGLGDNILSAGVGAGLANTATAIDGIDIHGLSFKIAPQKIVTIHAASGLLLGSTSAPASPGNPTNETLAVQSLITVPAATFALTSTPISTLPVMSVTPLSASKTDGSGLTPYTFTVTLSKSSLSTVASAQWKITGSGNNPAVASDFYNNMMPTGLVFFNNGQITGTIVVDVVGGLRPATPLTFTLTLQAPSNVTLSGTASSAAGTILPVPSPQPVVTLAASPVASNVATAILGTALPGKGTGPLAVALTADADFASGSRLVLNNGTLTYTPGLVTAALAGVDTIHYTVTDTVTGGVVAETQQVTLTNGPAPTVTLAAAPSTATNGTATLGTAAAGFGADPLKATLTADADFGLASTLTLNNGIIVYTPGLTAAARTGQDVIGYTITDTVTGAVTMETQTVTVAGDILTGVPTTVSASQTIGTFIATNGVLNSRDSIGGQASGSTLVLSGGGLFDLNAPRTLSNIATVLVSEGPGAPGSGTAPVVLLRDGLNVTVDVLGGAQPGNLLLYGGNDASVINLGIGSDTVVLGSVNEVVNANAAGGSALIQATAAQAPALVNGTPNAATTLEITNGGTIALNPQASHVAVRLDQATYLFLNKLGFISATGVVAGNTIVAGAANQTIGGVAGNDTLVGYSGYGDTFQGPSAGLNNDIIKNFGGNDRIDIADMMSGAATKLAYTGNAAQGTLTATGGGHSLTLTMTGSFTAAAFATSADGHGGTVITFV